MPCVHEYNRTSNEHQKCGACVALRRCRHVGRSANECQLPKCPAHGVEKVRQSGSKDLVDALQAAAERLLLGYFTPVFFYEVLVCSP